MLRRKKMVSQRNFLLILKKRNGVVQSLKLREFRETLFERVNKVTSLNQNF